MKCFAPAKINLALDVINKRPDGYHNLCMIMQTISLYDEIDIEIADKISIDSNKKDIPLNNKNLAWKAAEAFFEYTKINGGCKIFIKKVIPDGAGLGGGSSDAAEVILALNNLYKTNLTPKEMQKIAVKIGADCPFFIVKGCCLAEGIGEILTPLENNCNVNVLIYKPNFSISTKWVYENLNLKNKKTYDLKEDLYLLKDGKTDFFKNKMFNVLEDVSVQKYIEIDNIKTSLINLGADGAMMTGSGSAVFGIFTDEIKAKMALDALKNNNVFLVKFI